MISRAISRFRRPALGLLLGAVGAALAVPAAIGGPLLATAEAQAVKRPPRISWSPSFELRLPKGNGLFTEATGLDTTTGPRNAVREALGLPPVPQRVILRGPANKEARYVRDWVSETAFKYNARQDLTLVQRGSTGQVIRTYRLLDVIPVKWSIAGMDAGGSKVAVHTLELDCRRGVSSGRVI